MTNNEAAKWIQLYIDLAKIDPTTGEAAYLNDDDRKTIEAMEMAINALTAQSSSSCAHENDSISRQAAIDALHCRFADGFEEDRWWNSTHVIATLKGLPAVQSEQVAMIKEIRKWINSKNRGNADYFIVDKIEEIINKYE